MLDRARRTDIADYLAVALSISIPISTSGTSILSVCWMIAALALFDLDAIKAELRRPVSALPMLLLLLGALGIAWSEVPLKDAFKGLDSFFKLATLPLLILHFQFSRRGHWVFAGYLAACIFLLVCQLAILAYPDVYWQNPNNFPAPFKNAATQSGEFVTCVAVLVYMAIDFYRRGRAKLASACLLLCAIFVGTTVFVATARTPWIVAPVLFVILALRQFKFRGAIAFLAVCAGLIGIIFYSSPYFHKRMADLPKEVQAYFNHTAITSSGERLEFWVKAIDSIKQAPLIGHGTGTIYEQMRMRSNDEGRPYPSATPNPHQQTLAVAMQLGIVGVIVLWAMWVWHAAAVMRSGFTAWIGTVVVLQNIIGSLFNSHLFDFTQGWTYVVGAGVVIGMLRQRENMSTKAATAQ